MAVKTIALTGNPNVGKSTVFNGLTGLNQHTGNWPGKTVAKAIGKFTYSEQEFLVTDLPGTYSIMALSPDEEIAREFICKEHPDVVVVILDATCMERNLNLALQIIELFGNVVICVNLLDEAKKKKIHIDLESLSTHLGVPVVGIVARSGKNMELLKEQLLQSSMRQELTSRQDTTTCETSNSSEDAAIASIQRAQSLYKQCVTLEQLDSNAYDRRLDRIVTSKVFGFPIMILLLALIFWITLSGANVPSRYLFQLLFLLRDQLLFGMTSLGFPDSLIRVLLDGVYTTVAWVISVMLPPMAIFFPLFSLLEDSGYLPRVAFNLDRSFQKACAHGKQALTMCMGFGCNACGVIGCRIIDSPRERLIAILTNNFVPCNGRFPTLIAIIVMFFAGFTAGPLQSMLSVMILVGVILLGVTSTLLISKVLSMTILKGLPSSFTLELPPYRLPQVGQVILRSVMDRTVFVLGRAVMVAAPAGLILWSLANLSVSGNSLLFYCTNLIDPYAQLFGLDGVILMAFVLGFPANEIVVPIMIMSYMASGNIMELDLLVLKDLLVNNGWTTTTAICTMLFSLMHFPCATTCLTIRKETQSWKWTAIAFLIPTVMGLLLCFIVAQTASLLFSFQIVR
jgi:ferrous iron transport protein B